MKKLTLTLLAFLCLHFAYAQDTPSEFADRHNFIFQHLNRNEASTGILLDYGIEFQNLDNFKGNTLLDSNYVSIGDWRSIYATMVFSQYNSQVSLKSPQL